MQQPKPHLLASLASIICFPLVLMVINDSWVFFSVPGWVDVCFYEGYFLNLKQLLNVFPDVYYGTRLPWLLLGSSVHGMASPEIASYILRVLLFYAAGFSLFAIVRMLWRNDLAATMAALLMGSNTYFLWAIGWDYVNGMGLVLILVTTACLTEAATVQSWRPWLACAGIAFASMISTYLPLICFAPILVGQYLALNHWRRRNPLGASAVWFVSGAGSAVAFFGAVNWWLAGRFLYFMPQIAMARTVGAAPARWKAPNYNWVSYATWLIVPGVALVIGLILLAGLIYWRQRGVPQTEMHRNIALSALLLIGVDTLFLVSEIKGFWFLQASYFASFLIPQAYICIGAALTLATVRIGEKWRLPLIAAMAAILLIPFLTAPMDGMRPCAPSCQVAGHVGWLAVIGCLFLAAAALFRTAWLTVPALVALSLCNISTADVSAFSFPPSPTARAHFSMLFDVGRAIRPYNPEGNLRFWYNRQEPLGGLSQSIGWTFLWGRGRVVSEDFPNRSDNQYTGAPGEMSAGDTIVILSSRSDSPAMAAGTLAQLGLQYEAIGHARVQRRAESLYLNFVRLSRIGVGPASEIPLAGMEGYQPNALAMDPDGSVRVRTLAPAWTYAAFLKIPGAMQESSGACSGLVKLRVQVRHGLVGIGVLSVGLKDFLARRFVPVTPNSVDVLLEVPKLSDSAGVLVQSWDSGVPSLVEIHSVTVAPYGCPMRSASGGPSKSGPQSERP